MVHKVERTNQTRRRGGGAGQASGRQINLTNRVVRMTQLLMYGDRSGNWDGQHGQEQAKKGLKSRFSWASGFGGFTIYIGLFVALTCFFLSTIILIWVFLSPLNRWRNIEPPPTNQHSGLGPGIVASALGSNETNPHLISTHAGQWKTRCLDPYNDDDEQRKEWTGSVLSSVRWPDCSWA